MPRELSCTEATWVRVRVRVRVRVGVRVRVRVKGGGEGEGEAGVRVWIRIRVRVSNQAPRTDVLPAARGLAAILRPPGRDGCSSSSCNTCSGLGLGLGQG